MNSISSLHPIKPPDGWSASEHPIKPQSQTLCEVLCSLLTEQLYIPVLFCVLVLQAFSEVLQVKLCVFVGI